MATIINIKDGRVRTVYSDESFELMKKLGPAVIKRATHVEYDNNKGKWIATTADLGEDNLAKPGTVIAETDKRQDAIDTEITFLQKNL